MEQLMIDGEFGSEWDIVTSDSGTLNVTNGILRCTKTSGLGKAYLAIPLNVKQGSMIRADVLARVVSGPDVRLSIDNYLDGDAYERTEYVNSKEKGWTRINLKTKLYHSSSKGVRKSRLVVGLWTDLPAGVVEYKDIHVYTDKAFPSPATIAIGCISKSLTSNTWSVEKFHRSNGVDSVAKKDAVTLQINLTTKNHFKSAKSIVFGNMTNSKNNISLEISNDGTYLLARFSNGTNFLNLDDLVENRFNFVVMA